MSKSNDLTNNELSYSELSNIITHHNLFIWKTNINGHYSYFNDEWINFIGLKQNETCNILIDLIHEDDILTYKEQSRDAFNKQKDLKVTFRIKNNSDEYVWIQQNGKPNYNTDHQFIGHIGTFELYSKNILGTDQAKIVANLQRDLGKITAKEIRVTKELKEVQKIASLGSWYLNLETDEVYWSEELYEIFGFDSKLPPPTFAKQVKIFTPDSWRVLTKAVEKTIKKGEPYELELETITKNESNGWMWAKGEAVFNNNNTIIGLRGIAQDITLKKHIELQLKNNIKALSKNEDELRKSNQLLEHAGKVANLGAWEVDLVKNTNTWSKTTYEIHEVPDGFEPHPEKGIEFYKEGYSRNRITEVFTDCIQHGISFDETLQLITYKGNEIWVRAIGVPEMKDGKCLRVYGVFQNISEEKAREEELFLSSKKIADYKYALNQSAIVSITDINGIITFANQNFCDLSKYREDELIGQTHKIINSGYHQKSFWKDMWQTISKGSDWQREVKNKAKDGSYYWVNTFIIPFKDNDGKITQFMSLRYEITARKEKEIELLESNKRAEEAQKRLMLASNAAHLGIWDWDIIENDLIWDERMYELFGQDKNSTEKTFELWANTLHPDDRESAIEEVNETLKSSDGFDTSFRIIHPNGKVLYIKADAIVLRDKNGNPERMIGVNYDISELKERELRLKAQNQQLTDFSNIVAHNLRAPLVNIEMLTEAIEEAEDQQEHDDYISKLKSVIYNLNGVFDELIESMQVRQDTEIENDHVDLKERLDLILGSFQANINASKAIINVDFSEVSTLHFPVKYIDSIFLNLVSNALKYKSHDRKPIINIKTRKEKNNSILLIVSDNGLGMDMKLAKDNLFKIRKTFHNHPEAKGFGLFMIKTQIEAMQGEIWAESEVNIGTSFFVKLKNPNL